jgi:hypothetical protein
MLSIMDPVDIDELVVYRDDEHPATFYLLPDEPVISMDEEGVPDFYFIQYRGIDASHKEGGYVQFRTVLTISPERRAKVVAALESLLKSEQAAGKKPFGFAITSTEPVLADPIWTSGTVSIMTMQAGPDGLVTVAPDTPLPCDLAGSLGASGRLSLSPDGASIFWASFTDYETKKLPILITYQLVYRARVSATLTIDADGSTVVKQIWERAQPKPYYWDLASRRNLAIEFSGKLDKPALQILRRTQPKAFAAVFLPDVYTAVQSSVTDKTISVVINTDSSGTTGSTAGGTAASGSTPGAGSVQDALFKLATDLLTDDIIPAIFGTGQNGANSQEQPSSNQGDGSGTDAVMRLPDSETTTHFHIEMTSNSVINRNVNPTGALQVLISDPDILASCFKQLTLGNDFFSKKHVTISTAGIDFATDGISAIQVAGRYLQTDEIGHQHPAGVLHPDVELKSSTDTGHWDFALSRDASGVPKDQYEYATNVYYNGVVLKTDWQPSTADGLIVNPAAMGAVRVQLALTARREEVTKVSVALSYRKSTGDVLSDVVILTPDDGRKTWIKTTGEIRAADLNTPAPTYTYQFTYQTVVAGQIVMPVMTSNAETLEVPTPFPHTLAFSFLPQGSFAGVQALSVTVTYSDPAHDYQVVQTFSLDNLAAKYMLSIPVLEGGPQQASWVAHTVYPDGSQSNLPGGSGGSGTYFVGLQVFPPFKLTVMPDLIDFSKDIQLAAVTLTYHDPVTSSDLSQELKFNQASAAQLVWNIPQYAAGLPRKYDMNIRYFAFDRSKNAEFHFKDLTDPAPFLDRTAGVSVSS